ncbi:MAG: NAD(P)H-dependent oxidoreductase subunit E [Actinomycetales bacterium]|nr:NAD(P)H-dependent oxidoreductase subunit E [Actinomycetales bacterium]
MTMLPTEVVQDNADLIEAIDALVARYGNDRSALIPILQELRQQRRQISDVAMQVVANRLGITPVDVQGVVTFYHFLDTKPTGTHVIHLCRTISCAMAGMESIATRLENELGISFGETTPDGFFTLEWANCIGMCATAPAMLLNRQALPRVTPDEASELVARLRAECLAQRSGNGANGAAHGSAHGPADGNGAPDRTSGASGPPTGA